MRRHCERAKIPTDGPFRSASGGESGKGSLTAATGRVNVTNLGFEIEVFPLLLAAHFRWQFFYGVVAG